MAAYVLWMGYQRLLSPMEVPAGPMLLAAAGDLVEASESVINATIAPFAEDKIKTGGGPLLAEHLEDNDNAKLIGEKWGHEAPPLEVCTTAVNQRDAGIADLPPSFETDVGPIHVNVAGG